MVRSSKSLSKNSDTSLLFTSEVVPSESDSSKTAENEPASKPKKRRASKKTDKSIAPPQHGDTTGCLDLFGANPSPVEPAFTSDEKPSNAESSNEALPSTLDSATLTNAEEEKNAEQLISCSDLAAQEVSSDLTSEPSTPILEEQRLFEPIPKESTPTPPIVESKSEVPDSTLNLQQPETHIIEESSRSQEEETSTETQIEEEVASPDVQVPSTTSGVVASQENSNAISDPVMDPHVPQNSPRSPIVTSKKSVGYQVVARRYRPQIFSELIGQETVARALSNAIKTDRVGHAYLFTGARGVGKTSCARIFAKSLNCVNGPTTTPCLKCDSCIGISTGEDVDVVEIDGASNRGVDEIRQLRQNVAIAPSRSHFKIYIIDEVHMLTREAFNALLKTLEEPPTRVKFIFCTTEPNKIPVTILSRCQRFDFSSINGVSIASRLEQIAKTEGASAEDGVFEILARRANGSMRDAQSLLEQLLSFAPNNITQDDVHKMLGSVDDRKIFDLLNAIADNNAKKVFETLDQAVNWGVDFGILMEQVLGVFRDLMVISSGCGAESLLYSPRGRFSTLQEVSSNFGIRRILASLQILEQTIQHMRFTAQVRVVAEIALVRLCNLTAFQSIDSLINQLKTGTQVSAALAPSEVDAEKKNDRVTDTEHIPQETRLQNQPSKETTNQSFSNVVEPFPIEALPQHVPTEFSSPQGGSSSPLLEREEVAPWISFSQERLRQIWFNATDEGVLLSSYAHLISDIRVDEHKFYTVVFPQDCQLQCEYCENNKAVILQRITSQIKDVPNLRFTIEPSTLVQPTHVLEEPAPRPTTRQVIESVGKEVHNAFSDTAPSPLKPEVSSTPIDVINRKISKDQVESNVVVKSIQDVLEAELIEVLPPLIPEKKHSIFGN